MLNKYYRDTLSDPGAASADLAVDPKTMSVSGILCTASVDADGDSIEPAGIILDRHKLNPVVCLNHRSKDLPVGKAEDPNGNYTVRVKDYKLVHTAYFHDNALGAEVFKMYEARVLRGWSIAFIPLQMGMMPPAPAGRKRGSRITAGELMEYSAVTIPNNPETLAAYLGKGFHPDADAILRPMFEPFAAKLKEWANGWTPPAPAIVRPTAAAVAKSLYGPRLTARAVALRIKAFDPNEPRDETGKWTTGGGTSKKKDQLKTPAERYNVLGTRSPEFKAWFGDWENDAANASKVVDKSGAPTETHSIQGVGSKVVRDGKPVAVYHGTQTGGFQAFDKSKLKPAHDLLYGQGFYFTEDKSVAQQYEGYNEFQITDQLPTKEAAEKKLANNRDEWESRYGNSFESFTLRVKHDPAGDGGWRVVGGGFDKPRPELTRPIMKDDLAVMKNSLDLMAESIRKGHNHYEESTVQSLSEIVTATIKNASGYNLRLLGNALTDRGITPQHQNVLTDLRVATGIGITTKPHETKEVYLSIKKPFDIDGQSFTDEVLTSFGWKVLEAATQTLVLRDNPDLADNDTPDKDYVARLTAGMRAVKSIPNQIVYDTLVSREGKKDANELMAKAGYDGITHIGGRIMGGGHLHRVWIALEPTQIKAVANAGTFDPNDPNIHKSAADVLARITARQLPDPANIRPETDHGTSPAINPVPAFGVPGCR